MVWSEGYTSSLAAASLQELGLHRATNLGGGYWAWVNAGSPGRDQRSRCLRAKPGSAHQNTVGAIEVTAEFHGGASR
jgi:hypothetical protein